MLVMTAKVDKKKLLMIIAAAALVTIGLVILFGGNEAQPTISTGVSNNDARVEFLKGFGWEITTSPTESGQVRIPNSTNEVFSRYNELQKSQGYDLSAYAGKTVMRYVYQINNYPGATEPVYATVLIFKNQVIGGDVTSTGANGIIRSFQMPATDADGST